MSLIFVDCEAWGSAPSVGQLTEFGAVYYEAWRDRREWVTYHGIIVPSKPDPSNPAIPLRGDVPDPDHEFKVFRDFWAWLIKIPPPWVFVSDNPAFDWQWINDGFCRTQRGNPFGHSARRISDFYAGVRRKWSDTQSWKRWRKTPHDHNPVHDAMGNVEAFEKIMEMVK